MLWALFKSGPILSHIFYIFITFQCYSQNKNIHWKAALKLQFLTKYQCNPSFNKFIIAVLGLTFPLRLLCKCSPLKCLEQTRVPSFIEKFGPTSLLIAWIHLLFDVFFLWEAKKRNFFTRLLVPLVLLRIERYTAICRHLSAFPRWKSLVNSRISRLMTKKTIFCVYPPKISTISRIFYEKF